MEAQEYLKKTAQELSSFMEASDKNREKFPEFFNNYSKESLLTIDDEKMDSFYKTSQVLNDTQILFTKLASFIYFCKKINIELDLSEVIQIKGMSDFLSIYEPFATDNTIDEEGEFKIKDLKKDAFKSKEFKKNIANMIRENIPNE